jgi:ATP-dependent DNA ligase
VTIRGAASQNEAKKATTLPRVISPMLATSADDPFDSELHLFEILWEGLRAILFTEGRSVRIQDAFGRDVSERFPELALTHQRMPRGGTALDGVIVALDDAGIPSFRSLLPRLMREPLAVDIAAADPHLTFHAFDVLHADGSSVASYTLRKRKDILSSTVRPNDRITVPEFVENDGLDLFEAARQHGLSGIVAKELDAHYSPGRRSPSWRAIRSFRRQKFVIAGFTFGGPWRGKRAAKHRGPIESVLLGLYDNDDVLRYVGEASGTFPAGDPTVELLEETTDAGCPFGEAPPVEKLVFWCRPELAASVRFSEWTSSGTLRFPIFDSLRPDVPPETCRFGTT